MSAIRTSILGSDSRLYNVWAGILTRCFNPNHPNYRNYGRRGITVCEEWKKYPQFERWALNNGYDPNAPKRTQTRTIDKKVFLRDIFKGYSLR